MSNPERDPDEITCAAAPAASVEVMVPRDVPLGGPRAMRVRRTLPQRHRSLIGAWCFVDHYGPDDVADTGGMKVAPHPHTGLQTVSWLFDRARSSTATAPGNHAMVRPGEVNLMTAGRGISHSEVSTPEDHGSCTASSCGSRCRTRDRHADPRLRPPRAGPGRPAHGWEARVFLGALLGSTSPVPTYTPLLGAELAARARRRRSTSRWTRPSSTAVLVDTGGRGAWPAPRPSSTSWPTSRPGRAPCR